jgi:ectoine hydroxylase-related dioxygenase (phytanoyl-CoA dioxygenase family)
MIAGVRTHGVHEAHRNADEWDTHAEEIALRGYTIVEGVLDESYLDEARRRIDAVYERQVEEIGGPERLERIGDENVARCLLAYDDFFVELAAHAPVLALARRLLGNYVVLRSQNGVINRPSDDHYQAAWHRDLDHQHFVSSRPLAISALYFIDAFSAKTGGTHVLPGSHKSEEFPSPQYVDRHERVADAPAGSVLVFDSMTFHRAGVNSSGQVRRGVNHVFTLPVIQQQISIPSAMGGRFEDDERVHALLGYAAPPAASVLSWRQQKLEAADAQQQVHASSNS